MKFIAIRCLFEDLPVDRSILLEKIQRDEVMEFKALSMVRAIDNAVNLWFIECEVTNFHYALGGAFLNLNSNSKA